MKDKFCIVIHGGAGTILKENMTDSLESAYREMLDSAVSAGYAILENGGEAIDAVTKVITILEDSPLFNAGKGSVFTHDGKNEMDASIMEGKTLKAGAVAELTHVKNPILLARTILEKSEHVMMVGPGAEQFARQEGIELVDSSYFYTEQRMEALQKAIKKEEEEKKAGGTKSSSLFFDTYVKDNKFETVGCVALDKHGNIVAGTSTGGMTNKRFGRIGDSPIIGAGTYADNQVCGVSCTGWGEYFIRSVAAYDIAAQVKYKGLSLEEACRETVQKKIPSMGGDGGVIAIDKAGNIVMEFSTAGMYRASIGADGKKTIGIYR